MGFSSVIRKSIDINWNEFNLELPPNFNGTCYVYVDRLPKNVKRDMQKIAQISNIEGLKEVVISSNDYKVAQYFDLLMKSLQVKKKFDLLNDFEIKDRTGIDFSTLGYEEVTVPFDYLMHGINPKDIYEYNLANYRRGNIVVPSTSKQVNYPDLTNKVNEIIDEIFEKLPIDELDDIDKTILVSNWIQRNVQFIEGKISAVGGKKFICDQFNANDDKEDIMTIINKHFGVCNGITKLSVVLLSNPRINCQCNMAHSPGHAYFTQIIDGKYYVIDNTWCITRNPNHIDGSLKAASFSDEYLLIGEDKITESEDALSHHTRDDIFKGRVAQNGIPRERIRKSIDKLSSLGVDFSYTTPPIFIQHVEESEKTH